MTIVDASDERIIIEKKGTLQKQRCKEVELAAVALL